MNDEPVYVIDVMREIVSRVSAVVTPQLARAQPTITGVQCLVGHHNDIRNRLVSQKTGKYPLIAVFQDFVEREGDASGYTYVDLQVLILYYTEKTSYTEDRYDKVFKPILYPIYLELLQQIKKHKHVHIISANRIEHDKIDRPHWGDPGTYGNKDYLLDDVLDGVELRNLKLVLKNIKCK